MSMDKNINEENKYNDLVDSESSCDIVKRGRKDNFNDELLESFVDFDDDFERNGVKVANLKKKNWNENTNRRYDDRNLKRRNSLGSRRDRNINPSRTQTKNLDKNRVGGRNSIKDSSKKDPSNRNLNKEIENIQIKSKNLIYKTKTPSSYSNLAHNNETALLFYSNDGIMQKFNGQLSNTITIKFHDVGKDLIEIKDTHSCIIGTFYNENYVLSNKNGFFTNYFEFQEIENELVGIDERFIYIFKKSGILDIYNIYPNSMGELKLAESLLIGEDFYTFCIGKNGFIVFLKNFYTKVEFDKKSILDKKLKIKKSITSFCSGNVTNCVFYENSYYIQMKTDLFILEKNENILKRVFLIDDYVLTIFNEFIISLKNPVILLPFPVVEYKKFDKIQKFIDVNHGITSNLDADSYSDVDLNENLNDSDSLNIDKEDTLSNKDSGFINEDKENIKNFNTEKVSRFNPLD